MQGVINRSEGGVGALSQTIATEVLSELRAAVKLAYIWAVDDYLRVDELPGGKGYADVVFIPKPGSALPPMVVELKWDRPANAALRQIRTRDYPAALRGLTGECVLAGITYDPDTKAHSCQIERVEL